MRYSILLIEDNNDMRENIAEILELANYELYTAINAYHIIARDNILLESMAPKANRSSM